MPMLLRQHPAYLRSPGFGDRRGIPTPANSEFARSDAWAEAATLGAAEIEDWLEPVQAPSRPETDQPWPIGYTVVFVIVTSLGLWTAIIWGAMKLLGLKF